MTMLREKGIQPVLMSLPPIDATRYLAFICRDGLRKERIMDDLSLRVYLENGSDAMRG